MKKAWKNLREGYVRFVERQGFAVIVTVCVGVITATALWTNRQEDAWVAPTPPVSQDVSAAQLVQQSLKDAATPTPAATEAPRLWSPTLAATEVLRPFDDSAMVQSGVTGVWRIHDAVDLKASPGEKVYAMADGTVVDAGEDQLQGAWLLIDHGDGIQALYAGMTMSAAYLPGDRVRAGDTIGFAGNGMLEEADLGTHIHLRVTRDGTAIDPVSLWNTAAP